jgi:hypothetical protein
VWGFIEPGDDLSGCPGGGPSYVAEGNSVTALPPCWTDLDNISETLTDLGENIEEIAATKISNATELAALAADISSDIVSEMAQITNTVFAGSAPTGPDFVGGHFNLIIPTNQLTGIFSSADFRRFQRAFGGRIDGTRQSAVYGNAAQGDYTLHSKQHGNRTTGNFNFHFDLYNPLTDVLSTISHLFGDVIVGTLLSPCLDPAWQ